MDEMGTRIFKVYVYGDEKGDTDNVDAALIADCLEVQNRNFVVPERCQVEVEEEDNS